MVEDDDKQIHDIGDGWGLTCITIIIISIMTTRYMVEPSPGTHVFRWRGAWVRLERTREQQQVLIRIGFNKE